MTKADILECELEVYESELQKCEHAMDVCKNQMMAYRNGYQSLIKNLEQVLKIGVLTHCDMTMAELVEAEIEKSLRQVKAEIEQI